jgi:hypothetical protein
LRWKETDMAGDLHGLRAWKHWRAPVTSDDPALDLDINAGGVVAQTIGVHPYTAVLVQMLGKDTENDSATVTIVGWMDPSTRAQYGPPTNLWKGQVLLGSQMDGSVSPPIIAPEKWGAGPWWRTDTFDISGVAGGHNLANAAVLSGGTEALLVVPTLGFTHLQMHIADVGGGGTEMTTVGAIYRPIAMGGVV